MIEFKNVNKVYPDGTEAIKDFSLEIKEGELMTLIGPSGCGKTTTMKMINRLIDPTSGSIYINGKAITDYNIHELRWNIGYVLQQIALFPHMSIAENIAVVPEMKKWKKQEIVSRSHDLLDMVGLDPSTFGNRMPGELSGGQQQRIGVIRALAADPDIILMDEPFSALDPISREQLQNDIQQLQKEIKKTIVFVTHDMDEALKLGDRICLMKDGSMVQVDQAEQLIMNPANDFVKDFLGNKKSPWETTVGSIVDQQMDAIITKSIYESQTFPSQGTYIVVDEHSDYVDMVRNGSVFHGKTVRHDMTLSQAVELLQESDQLLFPVLDKQQVVGILTYPQIVAYLKSKTAIENGVTHQ
ncbi:ABC transporter ATP-binding protein [Oceanobacillus polygoni]|uniref:Quaternary amine transport ATP-binding protein n=1 Tax=Oceanobacillus polygoni TaxID=1235259 RepID=A0A9X0YSB2_9BACI|nr:ABC transporter ATP-binding protein [Oceanobacillus polygoni]MBP2077764.1 osmoprotectant transport system ATP-binding protein [Oceanobacillus polygoni]